MDSVRVMERKMKELVKLVDLSKHIVVLTGAGISTSAGIPDFRGPKGIWTLEQKQKQKKKQNRKKRKPPILIEKKTTENHTSNKATRNGANISFENAKPTLTHVAITKLVDEGIVNYVITQNVDGLHRRSGLSRLHHCCLHGCIFTEVCRKCEIEYFRNYDVGGMSFQKTGRFCSQCEGDLFDTLLDWEDALPEKDWERSQDECERSDLVICLGTSLRIEPVGSLPQRAKKFVIVNLQVTPYDSQASLIIRAPVDTVMTRLLQQLNIQITQTSSSDNQSGPIQQPPSKKLKLTSPSETSSKNIISLD